MFKCFYYKDQFMPSESITRSRTEHVKIYTKSSYFNLNLETRNQTQKRCKIYKYLLQGMPIFDAMKDQLRK